MVLFETDSETLGYGFSVETWVFFYVCEGDLGELLVNEDGELFVVVTCFGDIGYHVGLLWCEYGDSGIDREGVVVLFDDRACFANESHE